MLSCHGVGHGKLAALVILNKGIEAAGVHFCLKHHAAVGDIVGVYANYANKRKWRDSHPSDFFDFILLFCA